MLRLLQVLSPSTLLLFLITLFIAVSLALIFRRSMENIGYGRVLNAVESSANALTSSFYPFDPGMNIMSSGASDINDFPQTQDPVYILGKKYSVLHELEELRDDFRSLIWMTYRSGFPAIGGSGPTTDRGWGCMLRCGQMVLANALVRKHLGREWRWTCPPIVSSPYSLVLDEPSFTPSTISLPAERNLPVSYKQVMRLFSDDKLSPYSIHQISQMGESEGKPVGTWFGPNTVAQALKKLSVYEKSNNLNIQVAMDNLVIVNEIKSMSGSEWKPLILFIPLRLGLTDINPIYFRSLKSSFHMPQTLGIIGGRPSHALYFVGYVGNEFVYLDPHTTQSVVDLSSDEDVLFDDKSYHCNSASRMDMNHLDPSISLCFFCETEADFDAWCTLAKNTFVRGEKQPLFELTKNRPSFWSSTSEVSPSASSPQSESFANYDMPGTVACSSASPSAAEPNVPIEIAREAASLNQTVLPEDANDEDFEFL